MTDSQWTKLTDAEKVEYLEECNSQLRTQISVLDWKVKTMQKAVDFFHGEYARVLNGEPVLKKRVQFSWSPTVTLAVKECYITEGGAKLIEQGDIGPVYFWLTNMSDTHGRARRVEVTDITDTMDYSKPIRIKIGSMKPICNY